MGKKFVAPEKIQDLEASELESAVKDAIARAKELKPAEGEIADAETVAEAAAIRDFVLAAREENAAREAAAAENAAIFSDIESAFPEEEEVIPGEDDQPAEEVPAEEPAPAQEPAPAEEQEAAAPELVAASRKAPANFNRGSVAARAARNAPAEPARTEPAKAKSRLFAGNDVPGFNSGQQFNTLVEGADAILARLNAMPEGFVPNVRTRTNALQIVLPENKFSTSNPEYKGKDITELINAASSEARLPGGSLVAAGGWGAPSERSLDFCDIESLDGLITVPEVTITRGGLEWTRGPNFGDVVNSSTGFWDMTEAVAEAGTELKTSIRPEVPDFQEARLDAVGVMMENGLLLRQGWPELVERWAKLTLMAHQYKLNQKKIGQIRSLSGAAKTITNGFGNALDIFHILEMLATGERQRLLLSPSQTLEVLLPYWVRNVVRVDIANRNGVQDFKSITDAQIDSEFTVRGLKVQWLKGFQDLPIDGTTGLVLSYPDTVEAIFYPAGSFVAGVAPVISLDTIYDSTNLKKNDYVHLFVEQGVLMTNPCFRGNRVSFALVANGRRAQDNITRDFANPAV
ncbi:major capsid hexamer protein [Arthrobacter phage BruhMoment]|nr:major capsid hexamer protein [Arthrobacter phage BruhMoment]